MNEFKNFLKELISKSYLPKKYFVVDDSILVAAREIFMDDYRRWYPDSDTIDYGKLYVIPNLISLLCYRIARYIYIYIYIYQGLTNKQASPFAADAYSILGREIGQFELYYSADIGTGFKINHGLGTVVGARCKIGNNCMIHQNCTIGDRNGGRPTIGDNVTIYAGSMILGNIFIGNDSIIGANSVVMENCPPGSVIVGTPARIIDKI